MQMARILKNEEGILLVTSLVLLVVLTLIGIVAMQSSTLQERMAGNVEQRDIAFQSAESGLRAGEVQFAAWGINTPAFDGTGGRYHSVNSPSPAQWWTAATMADPNSNAVFIIEEIRILDGASGDSVAFVPTEDYGTVYRIRSRALSRDQRATVMLETIFVF